jgi:hypothetical protein
MAISRSEADWRLLGDGSGKLDIQVGADLTAKRSQTGRSTFGIFR